MREWTHGSSNHFFLHGTSVRIEASKPQNAQEHLVSLCTLIKEILSHLLKFQIEDMWKVLCKRFALDRGRHMTCQSLFYCPTKKLTRNMSGMAEFLFCVMAYRSGYCVQKVSLKLALRQEGHSSKWDTFELIMLFGESFELKNHHVMGVCVCQCVYVWGAQLPTYKSIIAAHRDCLFIGPRI